MLKANLLQLINFGIVIVLVFFFGKTTGQILSITGISWIIVSTIFLIFIIKNLAFKNIDLFSSTKELLFYGLQRVPGDFGMAALLTLPAIFTAHIAGVKEAGNVSFGISILNMAGAIFAPIGLVFLPKASQIIGKKDITLLRQYVMKILKITCLLTITGVLFFEIFAKKIIELYLGKSFDEIVLVSRIVISGAVFYNVYVSLRSIIDAYYVKAVNTVNIFLSLLLFLILSGPVMFFSISHIYLLCCFVLALIFLGGLTFFELKKIGVIK